MNRTNNLHAFHCGACMEGFDTREAREAHKLQAHADHYAELERALSVPLDKRLAPVATMENAPELPTGDDRQARTAPKPSTPKGNKPTIHEVAELIEKLDRKFEVEDMTTGLIEFADEWLTAYQGDFEFLIDVRSKRDEGRGKLTAGQAKGVLNCCRAEFYRRKKAKEQAAAPAPESVDVPAGHYAIDTTAGASNSVAFYRVDRPETGQWAGRTFVKRMVGGKPDERVPYAQAAGILQRIKDAGIEEAGLRYGREIGRCCACNRVLTNDESRALGIGPECRNK